VGRADVAALREAYVRRDAGSGEHAAVAVFLGYEPVAASGRFHRHVDRGGVDWAGVLGESWSSSERFLIASAAALWGARLGETDLSLVAFLDSGQYQLWQAMLTARRTGGVPAGW
jgi:hypothetical protein